MLRLKKALSKIKFCIGITRDINSFFKLLWNTKRFKWGLKSHNAIERYKNIVKIYKLTFKEKKLRVFLRTFTGDIAIFYEVFQNTVYELPDKCYKNAKTIVDLGANIGLATLYFHHQCPNVIIYSVEPEKSNFEILLKNLKSGTSNQNIIPLCAAIDSEDGEASIQCNGLLYNASIIKLNKNMPVVKTISMKTFFEKFNIESIDILKVDIEGTEKRLFEGDTDWLEKVRYLLIEFHSEIIKAFCIKVLTSKNFEIHLMKSESENNHVYRAARNNTK